MGFSCNKQEEAYVKLRKRFKNNVLLNLKTNLNVLIRTKYGATWLKSVDENVIRLLMNTVAGIPSKM